MKMDKPSWTTFILMIVINMTKEFKDTNNKSGTLKQTDSVNDRARPRQACAS